MIENPAPTGNKLPARYFGPMPDWETDFGSFIRKEDGVYKIIIETITDYKDEVFHICIGLLKVS